LDRAVVVVEGATLATFVTGTITMITIGILPKSSGSASSAGHCSRSQPMHCRSSSA
jgi:hypothetical protein